MTFFEFIKENQQHLSALHPIVEDFIEDYLRDKKIHKFTTKLTNLNHLHQKNACKEAIQAFLIIYNLYQQINKWETEE